MGADGERSGVLDAVILFPLVFRLSEGVGWITLCIPEAQYVNHRSEVGSLKTIAVKARRASGPAKDPRKPL